MTATGTIGGLTRTWTAVAERFCKQGVAPAESSYILRGPSRKGPESAVDEGQRSHRSLFLKAY